MFRSRYARSNGCWSRNQTSHDGTDKIEDLILELKKDVSIIMVTHNIEQAARVSDYTAFMYLGDLIEYDITSTLFTVPKDKRTEDYLGRKFG